MTASHPDPSQYETIKQLIQSGQREQARQLLTRIVKECPDDPHAWYGMAQVLDDPDRIKFCLQRALALMPDSQVIRDQLARLNAPAEVGHSSPAIQPMDDNQARIAIPVAGGAGAFTDVQPTGDAVSPPVAGAAHAGSLDDFATDAHISTRQERVKRRMKMRFFLGLPALLVLCCLIGFSIAGRMTNSVQMPVGHTVVYRAEGTARSNRVNYLSSSGASVTLDSQRLPWTKTYQFQLFDTIPPTLIVESHEPNTTVTCIITVDDIEVARRSSHGHQPQIVCRYEFPEIP